MDLQTITSFFTWCTIINGGILLLWALLCLAAPDWLYLTQSRWFPMPRETYTVAMYCFLGAFKLLFLLFNLVPLIAMAIAA